MKKSKLICELIFIFLLPLVFLSFNISINHEYVYDASGNFKTSGINVELNNINFINEVKDVHHGVEYVYYSEDEFDGSDLRFTLDYFPKYAFSYNGARSAAYRFQRSNRIDIVWYEEESIYSGHYIKVDNPSPYYITCTDLNGSTANYVDNFWIKDINFVDESIYKNPIYEICVQLDNYIGFDSTSTTMQIINAYTTLWVLMFFIWHLLYIFLDFFPHLFERKRE